MDRYKGKPFLRLLECYVLRAIGELSPQQTATLEKMTPKLRATFSRNGAWHEIIAAEMDFPEGLPDQLRTMWAGSVAAGRSRGEQADPQLFAELVVDRNLVPRA